jgi:hypothetical protein
MQKTQLFLGAMAVAIAPSLVQGATLTTIPMQGDMIMPMVSYSASMGMMMVMMPTNIPELTPLLVSNPADNFDPGDPWFDVLDPSQAGASFSQSYGFMMDDMSDPLPDGTQMWIRKISGPAELKFYSYSTAPASFDPIFGSDGATNALYWDGVMFHPVVTAPPGTNDYSATFEVYLLDTVTGQEVTNSSSGSVIFNWTDVSDGRPALGLALSAGVIVSWPSDTTTNWALESANAINATNWTAVTNVPVSAGGQQSVLLTQSAPQQFFRMRHVP